MKHYLVGGAVRDRLLDLPVRDRDWVVTGATEAEMEALGFIRQAVDFPVFLHPETGEEYALARCETKTAPGYRGFSVDCGPQVTLEQDLRRRDLTINAMAEDEEGRLIDPFDGRKDLEQGVLRHVTPAFAEDPVRLLRTARFAARLGRWGFRVSHGTQTLLREMVADGELAALTGERIWREMRAALGEDQPWRFFQVLKRCGALAQLLPALDRAFPPADAHAPAEEGETAAALRRATALTDDPAIRFTVLFCSATMDADGIRSSLQKLKVEKRFAELLLLALQWIPRYPTGRDAGAILDLFTGCRAMQDPSRLDLLMTVAEALLPATKESRGLLRRALSLALAVTPEAFSARGLRGPALGSALRAARTEAIGRLIDEG
jgi:tRNA nucleotidyltransferase (CCA-adding enzyme)